MWEKKAIDVRSSVPMGTTHACDRHGDLCERRLRGVEEIQGEILTQSLISKPMKDLIVHCMTGLFKNSPDFG